MMHGHISPIRSVSVSPDDSLALVAGKGMLKLWDVRSRSVIRDLPLARLGEGNEKRKGEDKSPQPYGLCCEFLPGSAAGSMLAAIGTKEGDLTIVDYGSGETVKHFRGAHSGSVWSLDVGSYSVEGGATGAEERETVIVTGSADCQVKVWTTLGGGQVARHDRTIKMKEDVVCVKLSYAASSGGALLFVSTLDSTVKVFFLDSLKFFLSLYGHSLPALGMDCSDDDALLATAGADKTVKIWGLDFGDCHRTMHGHTDSITAVRFVRRTHCFFTASKDKTVRYWDADRCVFFLLLLFCCFVLFFFFFCFTPTTTKQ